MDSLGCGGAERSLVTLLPFLVGRGYDITLMLRTGGGLFAGYVPKEVNVIHYSPTLGRVESRIRQAIFSLSLRAHPHSHGAEIYWKSIGRYLPNLQGEWDVAIAYHQGFPTFFVAEKVKAKRKLCWVNVDLAGAGYSARFCAPYYHHFDVIAPVADILSEQFVSQGFVADSSKLHTVYDIVSPALIKSMSVESRTIPADGRLHIVTVGRMTRQKGYDLAIRAAKLLREELGDFLWHFVGGGNLEPDLRSLAEELGVENNISFEGVQENPYTYMAGADIYVQTSRFEGFGLTVAEAKILGRPIVSTDFPVIHHQITNGVNGLITRMNPQDIANAVLTLAKDSQLAARLGENAGAEINSTAETECNKVFDLIEE